MKKRYKLISIIIFSVFSTSLLAQSFQTGTNLTIPDSGPEVCSSIAVAGVGIINAAYGLQTVTIKINHTYDGDLDIWLQAPDGTRVELSTDNGGGGNNYGSGTANNAGPYTVFDMGGAAGLVTGGAAPFQNTYIPEGDLGNVNNGQNANGNWQLCITDDAGGDTGFLNAWQLNFTATPAPPPLPCTVDQVVGATPFTQTGLTTSGFGDDFDSGDACGNTYMNGDDYVFTYTPPVNECVQVALTNTGTWVGVFITDGCPDAGASCVASNTNSGGNPGINSVNLTGGTTYYITVSTNPAPQTTPFDISIITCPPPPVNDEPCGAINLNVNAGSCSYQSGVLGITSTLSAGMPAPGCSSLGPDVWFEFTVPASGSVIVDMAISGGPTDMGMAWYTSSTNNCNNLDNLVECDDDDSQNGALSMICHAGSTCLIPGDCQQNGTLPPGTTVWVRIWEYGGNLFGPFDICAYDPGTPGAPSNCGNATVIAGLPYSNSGQTTCCRGNTYNAADGCLSAYQDGEDFLYEYTPAANVTVDITLTGTTTWTGLFVTDACPSAGGVNCTASSTSVGGNPTLCGVNLVGGTTYYFMVDTDPNPNCTPFNINITAATAASCGLNYTASNIPYAPDANAGPNIALPTDDRFSSSYVSLGFNFCFDGYEFTQGLVSSNGYLIFDPIGCSSNLPTANAAPGGTSDWSISAAVPNTNDAPRNAIMFPWQDIDPSIGGTIRYQTLGVAPNRRFVLTFDQIPYFSCNAMLFTGQLKLFETTNNIEMHIDDKVVCAGWNGGDAILGLHNYNGTVAVLGNNYPANWTMNNQGRLFTYNCPGPCIVVLPVTLVDFDGENHDNYNLLEWSTASEINNDYFLLERSNDGNIFEEVAAIDGAGNSNSMLKYSYSHNNPNELEYYRLKQVDFDGKFEYSKIIAVNSKKGINVNIYPNPANNDLFFNLSESKDDNYTIIYTNILGSVHKEEIIITGGTNTYKVNEFKSLNAGIYFIQILNSSGEVIKTQKIIKE